MLTRCFLTVPLSLRHEKVQREQESAVFPAAPRGTLFSLSLSPFCLHFCAGSRKPGVFFINTIKRADFCRRGLSPQTPLSHNTCGAHWADRSLSTSLHKPPPQTKGSGHKTQNTYIPFALQSGCRRTSSPSFPWPLCGSRHVIGHRAQNTHHPLC